MRRREIRVTEVDRTLRRRLAEELAEGLEAAETLDQIAERIRVEFNLATGRAPTIARTEVGAAVEQARAQGRRQAGVPLKSWLWSRKESGREDHQRTERATMDNPIPDGEDFTIAGTSITCPHPRATGVASQDINCGCVAISRFDGDTPRDVAARYQRSGFLSYDHLRRLDARREGGR